MNIGIVTLSIVLLCSNSAFALSLFVHVPGIKETDVSQALTPTGPRSGSIEPKAKLGGVEGGCVLRIWDQTMWFSFYPFGSPSTKKQTWGFSRQNCSVLLLNSFHTGFAQMCALRHGRVRHVKMTNPPAGD